MIQTPAVWLLASFIVFDRSIESPVKSVQDHLSQLLELYNVNTEVTTGVPIRLYIVNFMSFYIEARRQVELLTEVPKCEYHSCQRRIYCIGPNVV